MAAAEPADRYSLVSRVIHWTTLALVVANPIVAALMESADGPALFQAHASIGFTILVLTLARLGCRVAHPWPPLPEGMLSWEWGLARATHVLFYPTLLAIPLIGWATASTRRGDDPILIYGALPLPQLPVAEGPAAHEPWAHLHLLGVAFLALLVVLHVTGAIKHTYMHQEGVLGRMWPGANPTRSRELTTGEADRPRV